MHMKLSSLKNQNTRRHSQDVKSGPNHLLQNLYALEVYAVPSLAKDEAIAFNVGSHTELIRLLYSDLARPV